MSVTRNGMRFVLVLAVAIAGLVSLGANVARAQEGPAFGDSIWVAPYPVATETLEPDGTGPRVAEKNGEALGETILRAPFRVVFFPLKAVFRGLEWGAGKASPGEGTFNIFAIPLSSPIGPLVAHPTGDISSSFGIAAGANFDVIGAKFPIPDRFGGTYSTRDARTAHFAYYFGERGAPNSLAIVSRYRLWPARSFYGIGNDASKDDRSIYLDEEFRTEAIYHLGKFPVRSVDFIASYSDYSARKGYNDSPGLLDVFDPSEVPFALRGSEVAAIGASGRWASIDHPADPRLGWEVRLRIDEVKATDTSDLHYQAVRSELRGYVPVFAPKRVLAVRVAYASARPVAGSAEIPFYRMPQSDGPYRLAGFEGRQFRDRHIAVGRAEYRWLILLDRIWMTAFSEFGEVASATDRFKWENVHEDYGAALRFAYTESSIWRVEMANSVQGWKFRIDLTKDF